MRDIIFDMGNVMLVYDPARFVARETADPDEQALLMRAIFNAPEWPMMDSGALDEPDFEAIALKKLPERLHASARRLIYAWERPIIPMPGMAELIADCKAKGMGIYLLSNASRRQRAYWPSIPGSAYFDGGVVSAFERQVKPNPDIFHTLLDRYHLDPADCLFVDDTLPNVQTARALGMRGFHFTGDAEALRRVIFGD